jgi:general nucleoside transport system ATP-binding protein
LESACALELRGIRKAYPHVVAVDDVDLVVRGGEIHALVGENGAGKSTLAKIAFGSIRPDAGTVLTNGTVGLVHQHFELIGRLTVWENVLLGREPRRGWLLDAHAARLQVRELAERNALEIDPTARVEDLPIGVQQRVELLRELRRDPAILLLDEPTAALAPSEIETFFATIAQLARQGTAVLIVTHKLHEVVAFTRRVSVMRHGKIVAGFETATTSVNEITRAMVGGTLPRLAPRHETQLRPCFVARRLGATSGTSAIDDVTIDVRSGEIVGIAGVEGNGQTALADAIAGIVPHTGTMMHDGRAAVIPQDRQREGLILNWSIVENLLLGRQHLPSSKRGALLNLAHARADARTIVERFDVRTPSIDATAQTLSGGNQQKLIVGRALGDNPQFVLAYQPTRGIDVGAAALVQSYLIEARNAGVAILLISFDLDEILALSDRVLVMYRGRIDAEFNRPVIDRSLIARAMAGGRES